MPDASSNSTDISAKQNAGNASSMADNFKKFTPQLIFGLVIIFGSFLWNSNGSQSHLQFQVEADRQQIEKNAALIKEQSEATNNLIISLTKLSEAQSRLAADVKEMQEIQRHNTELLLNRTK